MRVLTDRRWRSAAAACWLAAAVACGSGGSSPGNNDGNNGNGGNGDNNGGPPPVTRLEITRISPERLLPGTLLEARVTGISREGASLAFRFEGQSSSGQPVNLQQAAEVVLSADGDVVRMPIDVFLLDALGGAPNVFDGTVMVEGPGHSSTPLPVVLELFETLTPQAQDQRAGAGYVGAGIAVEGEGFLTGDEGETLAAITGRFEGEDGSTRDIDDVALPAQLDARGRLNLRFAPELFGPEAGRFEGTLALVNLHADGSRVAAAGPSALEFDLLPSLVIDISPRRARRGQRMTISGRGFAPTTDTPFTMTTLLLLEGEFTPTDGSPAVPLLGDNRLELVPKFEDGSTLSFVLRAEYGPGGEVSGLAARPGRFVGAARSMVIAGAQSVEGDAIAVTIDVEPALQVVFIDFLPGFSDGLRRFGLRNVEPEIRARVLEVVRGDFAPWNLRIDAQRPEDFDEFLTVEIGGRDPNGADLFGLDASDGKDLGNRRLDEIVGGRSARSIAEGRLAFGGVFVEPLLALSPSGDSALPISSPAFDEIFADFVPELGGEAVSALEWPDGPRSAAIGRAITALGNLVGDTATHEVGHTLGMAIDEGAVHNVSRAEGQIMDSGAHRAFEVRAALPGAPARHFTEAHRLYLDQILPRE